MSFANKKIRFTIGVIYCICFIYLLFFATFRQGTNTDVNLIPFRTAYQDIKLFFTGSPSLHYIAFTLGTILGNFFLLLPIPILFDLHWSGIKKWGLIILLPILIEAIQYYFQVGSADMDDVILNALGFATGFWLRKKLFTRFLPKPEQGAP